MPFVTQVNFELVEKALANNPEALAALREGRASPDEIACAVNTHGSDEVEIDDDASVSHGDEGYWVSAWVWLPNVDLDDEED